MSFRGWGWDEEGGWRLDPWTAKGPPGIFQEAAAWGHLRSLEAGGVQEWGSAKGAGFGSPLEAFRHAPPDVKNVVRQRLLRLKGAHHQPAFVWKTSIWWEPFQEDEDEHRGTAWRLPSRPVEVRPLGLSFPRSLPPQVFEGLWLGHIYEALEHPAACPVFAKLRSVLSQGLSQRPHDWFRLFTPRLTVRFSLMPNDEASHPLPRGDAPWGPPSAWLSPLDLALPWLGAEYLALNREGAQKYEVFQHFLQDSAGFQNIGWVHYWDLWGFRLSTCLRGPLLRYWGDEGHKWSAVWEPLSSTDLQKKILGEDPPPSPVELQGLSPRQAVFLRHLLLREESQSGI